jgi:hypothetical protein
VKIKPKKYDGLMSAELDDDVVKLQTTRCQNMITSLAAIAVSANAESLYEG